MNQEEMNNKPGSDGSDKPEIPNDPESESEPRPGPVVPEARSLPELQSRAAPPPPDTRESNPVASDHLKDRDYSPPPETVETKELPAQDPKKTPETPAGSTVQAPPPKPRRPKRPKPPKPKWGWVLVVGPLLVAIAIIAWFQFRVLPTVETENNLPAAVDFPAGGVASRPDPNAPQTPVETTPAPPPVVDSPPAPPGRVSDQETEEPAPDEEPAPEVDEQGSEDPVEVDPAAFRQFGVYEFINLFDNIAHLPNLGQPEPASITGQPEVDQKLQALADRAGYISPPTVADTSQLVSVHQLQPLLASQWSQLEQAAITAGHSLVVTTGYLSPADQANIFSQQLDGDFGDQSLDVAVAKLIVPGYSRHQTGFAIDIVDGNNPDKPLAETDVYAWLSADNFAVAKNFGFIPGYNPGSHGQAEHQTAFELLYVGRDRLLSQQA